MKASVQRWGNRLALRIPKTIAVESGLALVCPITSQIKEYPFEVVLPAGSKIGGAILSDQLKGLDWRARKATMVCSLSGAVIDEVLSKLNTLLQPV
jgi:mRNA interferase MazF